MAGIGGTALEKQYDKIMKINMYMAEHYAENLWKDFGFERTGDPLKDSAAMDKIFEKIYEETNEKYPNMWYEYGFFHSSPRNI